MSTSTAREVGESIGVQTIEVGLKLLGPLVDAGVPLNLKTIAEAVDFSAPKAHRYLVSLIRAGLVEQDEQTGRYGLGQLAIGLGLTALGMLDKDRVGRSAVVDLRHETDHSTNLIVWGSGGPTVASVEPSPSPGSVFLTMRIGSILTLLRSASGYVFLAYLPRSTTREILEKERRSFKISNEEIDALIDRTRRHGIGWVTDSLNPGVSAFSAPVFDHDGRLAYAFTVIGQSGHFDMSPDNAVARTMLAKARSVSARLGCSDALFNTLIEGGRS
ncbi:MULTISPECIES: IclR family transcriptional regulator [unclassified Beijerinckia]|uniref:IclR family transcriptional regulator n=1 Tax=unclassified Beijerinckia TaxID=2638183 RepID=UPI00089CA26D|nr:MULTISPECIES: IclR family transcriptional regulator [unclassified Beijerinckia]MDH7799015.1 DNA-binding IclR family transcriptional regulator [Beijerinckia sp. GAS462]SED84283.1 transcriptional regulator, IclR family [Beijerinckia sp. 28-YEA-48]